MRKTVIIDGYNLIGVMINFNNMSDGGLELYRDKIVNLLKAYYTGKKVRILLVFDGDRLGIVPVKNRKYGNIEVLFSGASKSADRYIELLLKKNNKQDVEVVSSDNRIKNYAGNLNIPYLNSDVFLSRLTRKDSGTGSREGTGKPVEGEDEEFFRKVFGIS